MPRPGDCASALIVALWIIGLLSMLIASFAFDMHLEARVTSYCRKRLKAEYLARAGVERARLLLSKSTEMQSSTPTSEEDEQELWYAPAKRLASGLAVIGLEGHLSDGTVRLDIVPEPARRNINKLGMDDWERILETGGVPEEKWAPLIDSFFDWIDSDDESRVDGAESDYYEALTNAYRSKNAALDTVAEVLIIRNFTRQILWGGLPPDAKEGEDPMSGIADLLTVYGDGKVNVNAASLRVLMTLPEVSETLAQEIIDEREGIGEAATGEDYSFKNADDFFSRFPDLASILRESIVTDSRIYRITSVGKSRGVERRIDCIVDYDGSKMTILLWWEEGS